MSELIRAGHRQCMTSGKFSSLIKRILGNRRLVTVSNREPYEHVRRPGERTTVIRKTIGGLTSALEPVMQACGGTWIAWGSGNADRESVDEDNYARLPPGTPAYRLKRVWLSEEEVEKYYSGHANQTLWPLCHLQTDKVRFLRSEWDVYQTVNRRFALEAAGELGGQKGIVWFHDYHFATAPAMLRDLRPKTFIMQFWHIPWPVWEIFRQHPQRAALLDGMLGCDLICMQTDSHCQNFLECVKREFGISVDMEHQMILLRDRAVRVNANPISIDAENINRLAGSVQMRKMCAKMRRYYLPPGGSLGIGVERADYSKGIILRLRALELLFRDYPQWCGKFTFIQVSPVSRRGIPAYSLYQQSIDRLIRDLNRRFGHGGWQPVIHVRTAKSFEEIVALYRVSDIAIVSSRQDGMNLVGKEFIAARSDERGVLVLSEFAGASEEMHQSVMINPYDVEGFAYAIHTSLLMSLREQKKRMRQLRNHLFENTVYDWLRDILALIPPAGGLTAGPVPLLDHLDMLKKNIMQHKKMEIFCDYDGVLTPIAPRPEEARLDDRMRDLLTKLRDSTNVHVSIISGRSLGDITEQVSVERLTYAGNHGLEISGPRLKRLHPQSEGVHRVVQSLYQAMRKAMREFPGVIVEYKQLGVALHFRMAEKTSVPSIIDRFYAIVHRKDPKNLLRIVPGKCVLEAGPNVLWDKGKAVVWIIKALHGAAGSRRLAVYLGDDTTDEDAFRELRQSGGVTVFVGNPGLKQTAAEYFLPDTAAVAVFLEWITNICE